MGDPDPPPLFCVDGHLTLRVHRNPPTSMRDPRRGSRCRKGLVQIFEKDNSNNWNELSYKLIPSSTNFNQKFGSSVSIKDDIIVVGSDNDSIIINDEIIENNWEVHQLQTTANFSQKSRLFSWYIGGLNYQIEHHLFSGICHVHYRHISKIVRETAKEYNIPYYSNGSFFKAIGMHYRVIKKFGQAA